MKEKELSFGKNQVQNGCCGVISVNIHELVSKNMSSLSKKGKNTSQTGKQFRKYFYCFCLAEALLAEAEVQKTPPSAFLDACKPHCTPKQDSVKKS